MLKRDRTQSAGLSIVTKDGQSPWLACVGHALKYRGSKLGGNPAEDTLQGNVIVGAEVRGPVSSEVEEVCLDETDVREATRGCERSTMLDMAAVEIDTDKLSLGIRGGEHAKVEALARS